MHAINNIMDMDICMKEGQLQLLLQSMHMTSTHDS